MLGHMVFLGIKKDICERDVACETFVFCAWQCHIGPCNIRLWKYHDLGTKENNSSEEKPFAHTLVHFNTLGLGGK